MRRPDAGRLTLAAFRFFGWAPEWLSRAVLRAAAEVVWLLRAGGVRQLEANLRVVRPSATDRELRRLSRQGRVMVSLHQPPPEALERINADMMK